MKYIRSLKQLICLLAAALLLSGSALAAVCDMRIDSDGDMCRECALGNFGADAIRAYTGADIALFASGDLGITLPAGDVTPERIAESFPADKTIVLLEITAEELRLLLEESLSHITLGPDETIDVAASAWEGFFCVSGFTYSYDASAPVGQRVYNLPLEGTYTLAVSEDYSDGRKAGTIRQAVTAWCDRQDTVHPPEDGDRITVLGAWENRIIGGMIPPYFVILLTLVIIIFSGAKYRRRLNTER